METRFRTVTEYLSWDHDQLDLIRRDFQRMVEDGELERAEHTFGEFRTRLERHIRLEEEILFPIFEDRTHIRMGPTTIMRREHGLIRGLLDELQAAFDAEDVPGIRRAHALFAELIGEHDAKEEHILYPAVDKFLGLDERVGLVVRMEEAA